MHSVWRLQTGSVQMDYTYQVGLNPSYWWHLWPKIGNTSSPVMYSSSVIALVSVFPCYVCWSSSFSVFSNINSLSCKLQIDIKCDYWYSNIITRFCIREWTGIGHFFCFLKLFRSHSIRSLLLFIASSTTSCSLCSNYPLKLQFISDIGFMITAQQVYK